MYAFSHKSYLPVGYLLRSLAAISGAVIVINWLVLFVLEARMWGELLPYYKPSLSQAMALAVVFASYVVGWRYELFGAVLAAVGVALFFLVGFLSTGAYPQVEAIYLAVPGMLYLLAWISGDRRIHHEAPVPKS